MSKKSKKKTAWSIRQGDVLVWTDGEPIQTGAEIPREDGSVVLTHGEVTGHKHQIREPGVCHLRAEGIHERAISSVTALLVETDHAGLAHEEHRLDECAGGVPGTGATPIPRGAYFVIRQSEYEPEEYRNVAD